jgi:guanylate kinase
VILAPDQYRTATKGQLYVISGPSGVGKGTLVAAATGALPNLALSVSATTRPPRLGDVEGVSYHFKSNAEFDQLIARGGVLEWAEVHGNRYGTLTDEVQKALDAGKDLILEIDTQGNDLVRRSIPGALSIFIAPPSLDELRSRLEYRATEDAASVERRLCTAHAELARKDDYDVVIVNDDLDRATQELLAVIERHRAGQGQLVGHRAVEHS